MSGFDDHVGLMGDWMPPSPSSRAFFSSMINDDALVRSFADSGTENKSGHHFPGSEGHNADQNSLTQASTGFDEASNSNALTDPKMSSVLPSPTTGKFSTPTGNNRNSTLILDDPDKYKENTFEDTSSFAFKPFWNRSIPNFNAKNKVPASGFAPQSFSSFGVSVHSDNSLMHQSVEPPKIQTSNSHAENSPPLDEPHDDDGDQRNNRDPHVGGGQPDDGYNWRKYGQKQVKGSEYPRSYYKCTHPNCPTKKKIERSYEGHITEIIYKGAHNHPRPPPSRRSSLGSSNALGEMPLESEQLGTGANGDLSFDGRQDNLEATCPAPLVQEYNNGATLQAQNGSQYESGDGVDRSSTFSNDDDDDDRATHGSISLGYDGEGDESESKRRRIETYASEMSGATRAIREPRVVVQTTSDVDILDDGYRWRKYGQKVVKGNPNPRASHDLKSVITTYEGKHNHDVPAARNSSHVNSGVSNTLPTQQAPPAAVSSHMQRPEPSQIHGRFEDDHWARLEGHRWDRVWVLGSG
ncbi:hypothetical protein DH2020_033107 [Rehmannia glutinosa]|uniref:WRKY domain-containing protein n=1 Tax=Rehmannia glutinosa TaxID=99300 RepID=A0ABR0VET0_REHGL